MAMNGFLYSTQFTLKQSVAEYVIKQNVEMKLLKDQLIITIERIQYVLVEVIIFKKRNSPKENK